MENLPRKMIAALREHRESGALIQVRTDRDALHKFDLGTVVGLGNEHYALREIDKAGRFDGFTVGRLDSIARLTVRSAYSDRIAMAAGLNFFPQWPLGDEPDFAQVIEWLKAREQLADINDDYGTVTKGYVKDGDDECVLVEVYDSGHDNVGEEYIPLAQIVSIGFDNPSFAVFPPPSWSRGK